MEGLIHRNPLALPGAMSYNTVDDPAAKYSKINPNLYPSSDATIGADLLGDSPPEGHAVFWIVFGLIGILAALGTAGFLLYIINVSSFVRTINGIDPVAGEVTLVAGTGFLVTPGAVGSGIITLDNLGVIDATGGLGITVGPGPTGSIIIDNDGVVDLIAGVGLSVVEAPAGTYTVENTAVLDLTGTSGIGVTPGPTGSITLTNLGVIDAVAATGMSIVEAPAGTFTFENTGVIDVIADTGMSIVEAPTGTFTFENTGVTSAIGGDGITVSGPTGAVTISLTPGSLSINSQPSDATGDLLVTPGLGLETVTGPAANENTLMHSLTVQTALDSFDPLSPNVGYMQYTFAAEGAWGTNAFSALFSPILFPGVMPGDGGQGNNIGGTRWNVPAGPASWRLDATCVMASIVYTAGDVYTYTLAANLGALGNDPALSGIIPPGCAQTTSVASDGTNDSELDSTQVNMSCMFHANVPGPSTTPFTGNSLTLHTKMTRTGVGPATDHAAFCSLQVSRIH